MTTDTGASWTITAPGVWDIPEDAYHADPVPGGSLSSTTARRLLPPSCPALARHAATHPATSGAFDLGSTVHALVLGSGPGIVEVDADSWRTTAAKTVRDEARAAGQVPLLSKDLDEARTIRDAVLSDPLACALLRGYDGAAEQTIVWKEPVPHPVQDGETAVWARARLDWCPDPVCDMPTIVDVKTTSKPLHDDAVSRTVWDYAYHQQEDWYRRGWQAIHGEDPDFAFVFVSVVPPHLVRVVTLDDTYRADAAARNRRAVDVWAACRATGDWPAYPNTLDPITPPRWAHLMEDHTL